MKKMKKLLCGAAAAALTAGMLLTGCGSGKSSAASSETAGQTGSAKETQAAAKGSGKLEEFDVVLDWYPNAVHSFIYDAIEKGYFADEGLDVKVLFPSNNNDPISLAAAGKVDAGIYYMDDVIITNAKEGVPVKAFGTVVNEPVDVFASVADKNITKAEDLKGKTLGYTGTEYSDAAIKCVVKNAGLTMDDVKLVNVGFDLMSSMTTGNVDATYGCYINHEIPQLEKEGFKMNTFMASDYGIPEYYSLVFVAGEKNITADQDKYARFLRGCQKGFADMKEKPEDTLNILLDNQDSSNFPLDEDVEKKSLSILLPIMESDDKPFLYQDPAVWNENIKWLKENGLIEKDVKAEDLIVNPIGDLKK